ncbi:unnamed protein product, partial [Coregonus sp. 'balchen']
IPNILVIVSIGSCIACGRAEYRIGDECCPMCSPGNRVHKHCTEFTSTSCVSCIDSTFLDEPNGLMKCAPCSSCDSDGCRIAQRHSSCKPGQYIRHTGTTSTDTVCSDCTGDTYSDGSLTACQSHT